MRCVVFISVALFGVNAAKQLDFLGFGEMRHVYYCCLNWRECSQTTGFPRVWWDASCFLLWFYLVWVELNHGNSCGLVRCILFIIVALFGVNAPKPWIFLRFGEMYPVYICGFIWCECSQNIGILGFGEMQPVYYCGFIWCKCSQTIWILMVWWDTSCLLSVALFGVSAAKP